MIEYLRASSPQQVMADGAAVGVNALAGWSWLAQANSIAQLILTIVGIGAGIAAWRWHRAQLKSLKKDDE